MARKLFYRLFVAFPWAWLMSFTTQAQITSPEIDALVERTLKAFEVPGMAVAVIKDDKVIHLKGYGVQSLNTKVPINENTLFGIASNSKAFTTVALGILVDEGKIKWDDKVIQYIPEFKMYHDYVTQEFTIRDLLTHRSGLGLGAGDLMIFPDSSDFTVQDVIRNLRYLKPTSGFRAQYDYDNLLYIVAGEVVTRATGKSWEDYVEERIMQPLQMNHSSGSWNRLKDYSNVIDAHARVNEKVQVIPRHVANFGASAGGIYASVADMTKWVQVQLNQGRYGKNLKKQLVSEKTHRDMWTPQTIIPVSPTLPYNTHFSTYGLGWFLSDVKGYKQVSHTGGLPGMVTQVTLLPELQLGILVFTNQQVSSAFNAVSNTIKDSYIGLKPVDWVNAYSKQVKHLEAEANKITTGVWKSIKARQKANNQTINNSQYTGTYRDDWFGDIVIQEKAGQLWFTAKRSPRLRGQVFFYQEDTFIVKWKDRSFDADAFLTFEREGTNPANGLKIKAISPLTDFSYDFHDLNFKRVQIN